MAIMAGGVVATLDLDSRNFDSKITSAQRDIDSFAGNLKRSGETIKNIGGSMTKRLTVPLLAVGTAAAKIGMDFESEMSKVQALSGATGGDFDALSAKAREMGKATIFSATEAAEGLSLMALAGWDTADMMEGLEPILLLAGAAELELAESAQYVTNTLGQFGLEAKDAAEVTDVLAYTQANAKTDVRELGLALEHAGVGANAMGYDMQETSAILGIFADAGLTGSKAGTTMNAMFRDMKNESENGAIAIGKSKVMIEDSQEEYRKFTDILEDVNVATKDMTPTARDAALMNIFGSQAMLGMALATGEGTEEIKKFEKEIRSSDGSAKEMYDTMQDNLKGAFEEMKSAISEAGLELSETLNPMLREGAEYITNLTERFNELDPATKESIVKFGLLAAAIGPTLMLVGSMATGLSAILSVGSAVTGVIGGIGGSMALATTPAWALSGALGAGTLAIAPWVAGGVAVGVTAYTIGKALNEDAIPAVERFGDEVSESTQETVGAFLDLEEGATLALNEMAWGGEVVTEEMKNSLVGTFSEMKDNIVGEYQSQKDESLASLEELFAGADYLSEEEKATAIKRTEERFDSEIQSTEEGHKQIQDIVQAAAAEGRKINDIDAAAIRIIKERMKEDAVKIMSDSEVEQLAIMERLKNQSGVISAQQSAETVKNSTEQKEKRIAEAEEEYTEVLKQAALLRADGTKESADLADKISINAEKQRFKSVEEAEKMHEGVIKEAKLQSGEHVNEVDWTTGELKTKWEIMRDNAVTSAVEMKDGFLIEVEEWKESAIEKAQELNDGIEKRFNDTVAKAKTWGQNLVEGISEGMESKREWIAEKAGSIGDAISSRFRSVMEIFSPSGVFRRYGTFLMDGLDEGIDQSKEKPISSISKVADTIGKAFSKVQDSIRMTTSIIEKEYTLWKVQNQELQGSSEDLEKQFELQKQQQELLTEELTVLEEALIKITEKYGESSLEAGKYAEMILDLKIKQSELNTAMDEQVVSIDKAAASWKNYHKEVASGIYQTSSRGGGGSSGGGSSARSSYYNETTGEHHVFDRDGNHEVIDSSGNRRDGDSDQSSRSEIERISREHGADIGEAKAMDRANKRAGKKVYHDGGWVGRSLFDMEELLSGTSDYLKSDEISAILQEGEYVLSRDSISKIQQMNVDKNNVPGDKGSFRQVNSSRVSKSAPNEYNQTLNIYSTTPLSPSEIARKNLQVSRQLAMGWGM